jgi:hypothetical protein
MGAEARARSAPRPHRLLRWLVPAAGEDAAARPVSPAAAAQLVVLTLRENSPKEHGTV